MLASTHLRRAAARSLVPCSRAPSFLSRAASGFAARGRETREKSPGGKAELPPRLHVFFPRAGSYQASIEVKRRILAATPHMGGETLKRLSRRHSRKGTTNSFIAELESRLDRFIYRLNLVPSIFAARQMIGHRKIMVNGHVTNRSGLLLKPHDIVEPVPKAGLPPTEFLRAKQ